MFNKIFLKGSIKLILKNLIVAFLLVLPLLIRAQDITIYPNQPGGITYCTSAVFIAPNFTMDASFTITGMKVSINLGYIPGEDELRYTAKIGTIVGTWYSSLGYIMLTGSSNLNDYIQAMRQIQYVNLAAKPTNGARVLIFSLDDVDYLPETGHFYRYISRTGYPWTSAKAEAEAGFMKYHGLQGYLATITSAAENAFIMQKTKGVGWIGASDAAVEGEWRWVTGPEGLMDNGKGLLFWKGTGYQAKIDPVNYGPVNGAYHNWNKWNQAYSTGLVSTTWEPNDLNNEDYAHITVFPSNPADSYKWNDLANAGGTGDYASAGYLIEYGGTPGDPVVILQAAVSLSINTISFTPLANRYHTICQGDTLHLNQPDTFASYQWNPVTSLSNPLISYPIAKPDETIQYSVTATNGTCKDSAKFIVTVKPAPISNLKDVEDICTGKKVTLIPGFFQFAYQWRSGEKTPTIITGTAGYYTVTLTGYNGCKATDSVLVAVHPYPKMDLSKLNLLYCGTTEANLNISSDIGSLILTNKNSLQTFQGTYVNVPFFGNYPFNALVTNPYGCTVDTTVTLQFHKIPQVSLSIDETICYGYSLKASYLGDATIPASRFTWIFGGDTISNKLGRDTEQIPLGVNQTKRDLFLYVTEDGCTGYNSLKDILVIPDLKLYVKDSLQCQPVPFDFWATNTENVVKYEWDWGDGTKGIGKSISHSYAKDGYYDVNLTVTTDKGCTNAATIQKMVYVAPIPNVIFSIPSGICLSPGSDTLKYLGSANKKDTFYWDLKGFDRTEIVQSPDTTAGPLIFDLLYKPKTSLSLYVISQYGCRSTTESIEVKRRPVYTWSSSVMDGCTPLEVKFKALAGDPVDQLSYHWDFGDGNKNLGGTVSNTYLVPNLDHDIRLSVSSSITGCSDSIFKPKYIVVHPNPTAGFVMDRDLVYNDNPTVNFTDQSIAAENIYWDFGDGKHSRLKSPTHSYDVVGKRMVLQTVFNQFECQDTTSKKVLVAFNKIFAPNAFSPNANADIDKNFLLSSAGIVKEGYHMLIISRWNDVVFECKNEIKGWDGRMANGDFAPAGNYIWILECTDFLGLPHRQTGSLTLVY